MTVLDLDHETFTREWREWHERVRADAHGFLSITAAHWLTEVPERFDDAPGEWVTGAHGVRVVLAEDETLRVDGTDVHGAYDFGFRGERASVFASFGDAVVEVAKPGGHDIVRPRHPDHRILRDYQGTPTFAPDPTWVALGQLLAFDPPRNVTVGSDVDGLQHVYVATGQVEFELVGETHRLTVFGQSSAESFFALFQDATSGVSTYGAVRSLKVDRPDEQGRVRLDFNRATNLPCADTDFATCPVDPPENRLAIAIEAGETTPRRHP